MALFHYPSRKSTIVSGFSGFQRIPYCLTGILLNIEFKRNYLPGLSGNPFEPPHICPTGIYKKIPPIKDEGNLMFSQRNNPYCDLLQISTAKIEKLSELTIIS